MFSTEYAKEIKGIENGEDLTARCTIAEKLEKVLSESARGEIGITEFAERLSTLTLDARILSTRWQEANK